MNFDKLVIDRVLEGIFEDTNGNIIAALDQVQNLSISTSSESKDKTDAKGVLIKRYYTSKSVEVSAENAVVSLDLIALQNGKTDGKAEDADVILPRVLRFNVERDGDGNIKPITLPDSLDKIDGRKVTVTGCLADGLPDVELNYKQADEGKPAAPGVFSITNVGGKATIAPPTDATSYVTVVYEYTPSVSAARVDITGDGFPDVTKLILTVLVTDVCNTEDVRIAYIVFPKFQMSPDFDLSIDTESAHPFSGIAAQNYCAAPGDKQLYYIAISEDSTDENDIHVL